MKWSLILTTSVAVGLLVGGCSSGSVPRGPDATPTPGENRPGGVHSPVTVLSGRIVFDNLQDVWSMMADGTGLTQLTHSTGPDFDATWSPDGKMIAFRSERSGDPEIWLMHADGSGQHRLTRGLAPAWSPDGALIAFAGPSGSSGIITLIRPDGTGLRQLPYTEGGEYPSWSPDGTRIAFNSNLTGDHLMFVADADGSNVVGPVGAGEGWQVDWSPDGRSILFTSHRDYPDPQHRDLYLMRPDGSDVRRLTHQGAETPTWSPDGHYIVFSYGGLFVINADGTGVTPLPTDVGETELPDWTG